MSHHFLFVSGSKRFCWFCVQWTPEGRRLVTGASSGEFTLWNGLTFNFETILQVKVHRQGSRALQNRCRFYQTRGGDDSELFSGLLNWFQVQTVSACCDLIGCSHQ